MNKQPISIGIDKDLINKIDLYLNKIGLGANRSALITEALKDYLKRKGAY